MLLIFTDKRKIQDGERLKIEFKKDTVLKKKQTISELYEEEVPMRKMKKEREKKDRELHALPKLKMNEDVTVTKDEHVRSIQLKGNNHFGLKNILVAMEDLGFAQRKVWNMLHNIPEEI